jgi:hypothetical protein
VPCKDCDAGEEAPFPGRRKLRCQDDMVLEWWRLMSDENVVMPGKISRYQQENPPFFQSVGVILSILVITMVSLLLRLAILTIPL